jgi:hypothetical protein
MFLIFSDYYNALILKIILKKLKIYIFNKFMNKKYFTRNYIFNTQKNKKSVYMVERKRLS